MDNFFPIDQQRIQDWNTKKYTFEQVRQELTRAGMIEEEIIAVIKTYQKLREEKRRTIGFICMATGAVLGFVSCVMTMMELIPGITWLFLYGFTTLAIIIILIGCYLVFE